MKRLLVALTLALLVSLVVGLGTANATHSEEANSTGPPKDFALGGGKHLFTIKFSFSAHSGPLGEDPKGQVQLDFGDRKIKAEVTCVIVDGNEAFITGFSDELPGNGIVVTHAVDNGEPSDPQPDLLRNSFEPFIFESFEQPGCFLPVLEPVPVTQGNIVVHDGQPN